MPLVAPPPVLAPQEPVPGVIVDHLSAKRHRYVGSPSLAILPSGDYIATHDEFGPKSGQKRSGITLVFRSTDRGASWSPIATIKGAFWSTLFVHRDRLYLLGTDKEYGNLVIRRSDDGGVSWTQPRDEHSGFLRGDFEYHCAPVPVLVYRGRLWRGIECRNGSLELGLRAPDVATLDTVREKLAAQPGLSVAVTAANPGDGGIDGRIKVGSAGGAK